MLMIRGILRVVVQVVFFGAILFLPIGTWQWPRAVQFLVAFGIISLASTVALAMLAPASLEARVKRGATKNQPRADKMATLLLALFHIAWFILIPNDVIDGSSFRNRPWGVVSTRAPSLAWLGMGSCSRPYGRIPTPHPWLAIRANENNCSLTPASIPVVRHPMYLGHLFFLLGLPFWLGELPRAH